MARTNFSRKPKLTFAISYGLACGPLHAQNLIKLLQRAGYRQALDVRRADIIIAHSAGCWLVPIAAKPKIVIYVGLPLPHPNPSKPFFQAILKGLRLDVRAAVQSRLKGAFYSLRQPRRTLSIIHMTNQAKPITFPGALSVVIANQHDPWQQSDQLQRYAITEGWSFINLPGSHDDLWEHPEHYPAIIDHYARLLAQTNP